MVAPYGTLGQPYQDYRLHNGRVHRVDPIEGGRPTSQGSAYGSRGPAPAPAPPQHLPSLGGGMGRGMGMANPGLSQAGGHSSVKMLQHQLQNSSYHAYASFVARVKKIPRTSASRLEHDSIVKALSMARLVVDQGMLLAVLRDLDRAPDSCVSFVTLQNFLNQSWPTMAPTDVQNQTLLTSGPSPDDPHQGAGSAQYSLPTAASEAYAPAMPRQPLAHQHVHEGVFGAPARFSPTQQYASTYAGASQMPQPPQDLYAAQQAPPGSYMPQPPMHHAPTMPYENREMHQHMGSVHSNRADLDRALANDASMAAHNQGHMAHAPAQLPPNPFPGAMTMSSKVVLPPLGQANQQHLARFERDRGWNGMPDGGQERQTTSSHSNRSFGGPHRHAPSSAFNLDGTLRDNVSRDERRALANVPNYPGRHHHMDTASNFMSDGTLRDNVSSDENQRLHSVPQYNHATAAYDTNSSFNYDGSLKDHVSVDEKRGGISGGGMRTTPTRMDHMVGADHIGSGMNPTEHGSQPPPFAGLYVYCTRQHI